MKTKSYKTQALLLGFVIFIAYGIAMVLGANTYYINFWPTDSYFFYLPAARQLFSLDFFSQMHSVPDPESLGTLAMHGKETLVLGIALMQKLLNDTESLFPNILLLIQAQLVSSVLIYLIFKRLFGTAIGLISFALFTSSFWPYLYILQGAHQPLVLFFFLVTFAILLYCRNVKICYFFAGLAFGLMAFSSPTAVLYFPYFLLLPLMGDKKAALNKTAVPGMLMRSLFAFAGCLIIVIMFTLPDIITYLREYITFVFTSQVSNHFYFYREYLARHLPAPYSFNLPNPLAFRGGGWLWIVKYFTLIMPVMFTCFLLSIAYLLSSKVQRLRRIPVILLCLSTPVAVEISQVAQFGRNYYSWFFGILFVIAYALHEYAYNRSGRSGHVHPSLKALFAFLILVHVLFNVNVFINDAFPSRMATDSIYRWLTGHNIHKINVSKNHPHLNLVYFINNPKSSRPVLARHFRFIRDVHSGLILIPPATGKNILADCSKDDYEDDPDLNELYRSGQIERYAVKSFKTMASSKIWVQEEEVCTYRDLILRQISDKDRGTKGVAYLLDARKLQKEWFR